MKRIERAYEQYPDGVVVPKGRALIQNTMIENCCPYFLDCGEDDLDEATKIGTYGDVKGCRGITCKQCWDKEEDNQMNALQQLELDELGTLSEESKQRFKITDMNSLNWTLRKLAALDTQQSEAQELAKEEHDRINAWLASQSKTIQNSRGYLESLITDYATTQRKADPKWKAKSPYGKVGYRKQKPSWEYDEKSLVKYLQDNKYDKFIRNNPEPMKNEIKEYFAVSEGKLINQETGEIIPGVVITERDDKLEIKVEG